MLYSDLPYLQCLKSIRFLNSVCAIFTLLKQGTFHETYQSAVVYKYVTCFK